MKKLQIPLTDEFMATVKIFALQNNTTLKDVVIAALTSYIDDEPKPQPKPKTEIKEVRQPEPAPFRPTPTASNWIPKEYTNPLEDHDFIIPKTARVGSPVIGMTTYTQNGFEWYLADGYRPHFDKTNKPIPFRMTDPSGKILEPSPEEIAEVEATGLKVVFES